MKNYLGDSKADKLLTLYADDTLLQEHFQNRTEFDTAFWHCRELFNTVESTGFKVKSKKSALRITASGTSAQQALSNCRIKIKKKQHDAEILQSLLLAFQTDILGEHVSLSMFVGQDLRVERKEDNIKALAHRVGNSPFQGHYRSCVKREHQCFHADDSAEPTAISNLCSRVQSGIYLIHVSKT